MPEDALITAIEQDARQQCEKLLRDAEEAAAEMVEAAGKETERESSERIASLSATLDRKSASAINAARTKAAGLVLSVRSEMAEEVLKRSESFFAGMDRDKYSALLNRFYAELKSDWLEAHEPDAHVVLLNPADMGLVTDPEAEFKGDESVSLGVVFLSRDGRLRYENTVASRIRRGRDTLLPIVDGILTGKG